MLRGFLKTRRPHTVTLRCEGREATEASKGDGPDLSAQRGRILRGSGAGDGLRRSRLTMTE